MGPPKKRPPRVGVDMRIKQENHFEYRWDTSLGHYYLFNPYTGETILGEDHNNINRSQSMWHKPDKFASKEAYSIQLWPQGYASRRWGVRRYEFEMDQAGERTFAGYERAATVIKAVYRGYVARQAMSEYYRGRYFTAECKFSKYLYFVDTFHMDSHGYDTVWHKPLCAKPSDIRDHVSVDPDDHMADGDKYGYRGFEKGPYLKQESLGKGNCTRAVQKAFTVENPYRPLAVSRYEDIDLDKHHLGDVIAWFDGLKVVPLPISSYVQVRAAICNNNWDKTLEIMDRHNDHVLTRLYCWHSFSKTAVPLDGVRLSAAAADVLSRLTKFFENKYNRCSPIERNFMLNALHNILILRAGRAEFLSTAHLPNTGNSDERARASEKFLKARISMLNKDLAEIDMDVMTFKSREKGVTRVRTPSSRGCSVVVAALLVLQDLSWEIEIKELMSEHITEYIYYAMKRCKLDGTIQILGCGIFYSLCYRCESGQEFVLTGDSTGLIKCMRENHGGDPEVEYAARRLELSLKFDGWRGNIERLMNLEIRGKKIPIKFLKQSPHERRFTPDHKFSLEEAEDERNAAIDKEDQLKFEAAQRAKEEAAYRKERAAKAKAQREAEKAVKAEKRRPQGVDGSTATDMDGNALQATLEDAHDTARGTEDEDDIMGAIAKMESDIAEYKHEVGSAGGFDDKDTKDVQVKASGDDNGSVMSKLSFAEEDEIASPWGSVANSPRAESVIQTPLHLTKKKMKPAEREDSKEGPYRDEKGEDAKSDSLENMKTQEAVHSREAGEAESKASKDAHRDTKDEK